MHFTLRVFSKKDVLNYERPYKDVSVACVVELIQKIIIKFKIKNLNKSSGKYEDYFCGNACSLN